MSFNLRKPKDKATRNSRVIVACIFLLLIAVVLTNNCEGKHTFNTVTNSDTIVVVDTITNVILSTDTVHYTEKILDTIFVELPSHIDTSEVIKDYYKKYTMFKNFNDGTVSINTIDTLFKNKILGTYLEYQIINKTNVITKKENRISLGINVGYGATKDGLSPYFGLGLSYKIKLKK